MVHPTTTKRARGKITPRTKTNSWMQRTWRPMMAYLYMITCAMDFIIFPIAWSALQASLALPLAQWHPLTLEGAGLFHLAMGAVLGIAAYGRTQEKLLDSPIDTPANTA